MLIINFNYYSIQVYRINFLWSSVGICISINILFMRCGGCFCNISAKSDPKVFYQHSDLAVNHSVHNQFAPISLIHLTLLGSSVLINTFHFFFFWKTWKLNHSFRNQLGSYIYIYIYIHIIYHIYMILKIFDTIIDITGNLKSHFQLFLRILVPKFYFWRRDWVRGTASIYFWDFSNTSFFSKILSLNSFDNSYIVFFCTTYYLPLYLWWIKPILKSWNIS